ncbi:MAG: hypothetical protein ACKOWH_03910 [Rhodoluna sp.]
MNFKDDSGSAVIELLLFGIALQLPLLLFTIQLAESQSNQFAAESAARHSLRSFVLFETPVEETANQIVEEFGITETPNVEFSCVPNCQTNGGKAQVVVKLGSAVATSRALIHK